MLRSDADVVSWLAERTARAAMTVRRVGVDELAGWSADPESGALRHRSGRFFSVEGLDVRRPGTAVPRWRQPIMRQPDVGILGLLTTRVDGVPHVLLQAKIEPGNPDGCQLAPTVQATPSNYTAVHGGRSVPYLDRFRAAPPSAVVADVRQSEHGSWFLRKRNRNMVVEVEPDLPVLDGFRWCSLPALRGALATDDLVAMDARTTLSCLPPDVVPGDLPHAGTDFAAALHRSLLGGRGHHPMREVLSLVSRARSDAEVSAETIPLDTTTGWTRAAGTISREDGAFFRVIGVDVEVDGREVARWSQPMFAATGTGLAGLVVAVVDGVLHALMHLRAEPGFVDVVELAPTVQCIPASYRHLPAAARPAYLDLVADAAPADVHFDTTMTEDGGRLFQTRTRHVVVEADAVVERPGYVWMTVAQLLELVRHSHYLDVQARSLLACLVGLALTDPELTAPDLAAPDLAAPDLAPHLAREPA